MTAEDIIGEIEQRIETLKEEDESQHKSDIENAEEAIRAFQSISRASSANAAFSPSKSIASLASSIADSILKDLVSKLHNEAIGRAAAAYPPKNGIWTGGR